jgi:HSP20 family protein
MVFATIVVDMMKFGNLMFDDLLDGVLGLEGNVNLLDSDKNYVIEVMVPGLTKEDISLTVKNGRMTVKGSKKQPEGQKYLKQMFKRYQDIYEVIVLPSGIQASEISAKVENGILEVTIPKSNPESITIL